MRDSSVPVKTEDAIFPDGGHGILLQLKFDFASDV